MSLCDTYIALSAGMLSRCAGIIHCLSSMLVSGSRYVHVFTGTYLQIPTVGMCRYLTELFRFLLRRFLRGFIAVCAVASPSHGRRMAVASPSHRRNASPQHRHCTTIASSSYRRNASALHRVAARNAGDLSTSLESHLPVVPLPTRCTRKKWSFSSGLWPSGRSDDEDTCRSYGRNVVTR